MISIDFKIVPTKQTTPESLKYTALTLGTGVLSNRKLDHLQERILKEGVTANVEIIDADMLEFQVNITDASPDLEVAIRKALS